MGYFFVNSFFYTPSPYRTIQASGPETSQGEVGESDQTVDELYHESKTGSIPQDDSCQGVGVSPDASGSPKKSGRSKLRWKTVHPSRYGSG